MSECRLGMGVLLHMLGDSGALGGTPRKEEDALADVKGGEIVSVALDDSGNGGDGALVFTLAGGWTLTITDQGRSCCESRYMKCDDDLDAFCGSTLQDITIECGGIQEGEWGDCHEIQFLLVHTSVGIFTVNTHNEHNGYYGGFYMTAKVERATEKESGDE
jgi:hypothetical protein